MNHFMDRELLFYIDDEHWALTFNLQFIQIIIIETISNSQNAIWHIQNTNLVHYYSCVLFAWLFDWVEVKMISTLYSIIFLFFSIRFHCTESAIVLSHWTQYNRKKKTIRWCACVCVWLCVIFYFELLLSTQHKSTWIIYIFILYTLIWMHTRNVSFATIYVSSISSYRNAIIMRVSIHV